MTNPENSISETPALHNDIDSNGIPILNDVVEEVAVESAELLDEPVDAQAAPTPSQSAEISEIKQALRSELSNELNELIHSTLLDTALQLSSKVEEIIEGRLSDAMQKQLGEQLKTTLEERFKNNHLG